MMHIWNISSVLFLLHNLSMKYEYFNNNPAGRKVGDCAVRAVSKALNIDWETAMEIAEILNRYEIKPYYADSIEEDDYRDIVNKIQKVGDCMFETIFEWIIKKYGVEE